MPIITLPIPSLMLYVDIFFCEPHRINLLLYNNSEETYLKIFLFQSSGLFLQILHRFANQKCRVFIEEQLNTVYGRSNL